MDIQVVLGRARAAGRWASALGTLRRLPLMPLAVLLVAITAAVFAPLVAPHDPMDQSLLDRLTPPMWQKGGQSTHILGTDTLGRDIFSRLIFGARVSLTVAGAALVVGGGVGLVVGVVSGYLGGAVDTLLMRLVDSFLAIPGILISTPVSVSTGMRALRRLWRQ